jgi:hypothetical protein
VALGLRSKIAYLVIVVALNSTCIHDMLASACIYTVHYSTGISIFNIPTTR